MADDAIGQTRHEATASEYGVLGVQGDDYRLDRVYPSPSLAPLVERYWQVSWDLEPGRRVPVEVLPHPSVNLGFEGSQVLVHGVGRERFRYDLVGAGRVFGVKFRPGGFHPFLRGPVSALTDQVRPLSTLWGQDEAAAFARDLAGASNLDGLVAVAERYLARHWPPPDPEVERVGTIVRALLGDRAITRVDDVTARFGLSVRGLQRLFQRYVGVNPKWVLSRYRLHEAAARLAEGTGGTWTEVAVELGYFDQSHFIRDFTRAVGQTPATYAEACRSRRIPVAA